jgi:hypothetical protein
MTASVAATSTPPRRRGRSAVALLLGFVAVVLLSLGTDEVLHLGGVLYRRQADR